MVATVPKQAHTITVEDEEYWNKRLAYIEEVRTKSFDHLERLRKEKELAHPLGLVI